MYEEYKNKNKNKQKEKECVKESYWCIYGYEIVRTSPFCGMGFRTINIHQGSETVGNALVMKTYWSAKVFPVAMGRGQPTSLANAIGNALIGVHKENP